MGFCISWFDLLLLFICWFMVFVCLVLDFFCLDRFGVFLWGVVWFFSLHVRN